MRAAEGGVGFAKTGGNYSASLLAMIEARKEGCQQVLWLDAKERKYLEELSGMNIFAVYGDTLRTPRITEYHSQRYYSQIFAGIGATLGSPGRRGGYPY